MYITRSHLRVANWRVIFCEILSIIFVPLYQYTLSCSSTYLYLNQCLFIYHVFERFGFIPEFKKPSVIDFSVLRGVGGCLISNTIKADCMPVTIFPLLKVPHVSDSAAEDTTFRKIFHSV